MEKINMLEISKPKTVADALALNTSQRSVLAADLMVREYDHSPIPRIRLDAQAKLYGISPENLRRAIRVLKQTPKKMEAVWRGKKSLNAAGGFRSKNKAKLTLPISLRMLTI